MDKNPNIYYVYTHRHPETGEVFYVGMGQRGRAWDIAHRGDRYEAVISALVNEGYLASDIAEIVHKNCSFDDAKRLERELIETFPPDQLVNHDYAKRTANRDLIIKLYNKGYSYTKILSMVDTHALQISEILDSAGIEIKSNKDYNQTRVDRKLLAKVFEQTGMVKDAAEAAGCSRSYAGNLLRGMGYNTRSNKKYDHSKIFELHLKGVSDKKISETLNYPTHAVAGSIRAERKRRGLGHDRRVKVGVDKILEESEAGFTPSQIASKYGVRKDYVIHVIKTKKRKKREKCKSISNSTYLAVHGNQSKSHCQKT